MEIILSYSHHPEIYSIAQQLGKILLEREAVVTTAESCTGGGIAEAITAVAGSSQWFDCAFIAYANKAKQKLLGVEQSLLDQFGAVSKQVVEQMALGAIEASKADYAVAVSGIAGPDGGTANKPVGTVWICWHTPKVTISEKFILQGDRQSVREQAVKISLQQLLHHLS
jgi:nicotinamide-nucleotide amidase